MSSYNNMLIHSPKPLKISNVGLRSGWSYVSKYLQQDTGISDKGLGMLNMSFLLTLAICIEFSGHIVDKVNPKIPLVIGLLFSTVSVFLIAFSRYCGSGNIYLYGFFQIIYGLFDSAIMPAFLSLFNNWYSKNNRGVILSMWIGSRNFGDIIGSFMAEASIQDYNISWQGTLMCISIFPYIMVIIIQLFLVGHPQEKGFALGKKDKNEIKIDENQNKKEENIAEEDQEQKPKETITIFKAIRLSGVLNVALSFMCLKALNYGLVFWLPKFLQDNNLSEVSGTVVILWSIGMLIGGVISGYLGDLLKKRAIIMPPSCIFLLLTLYGFNKLEKDEENSAYFCLLGFLIGIFLGGTYNIVGGTMIIDLGNHPKLKGNAQAVGTMTGLIEGSGSLAAALAQVLIPSIGARSIFVLFMLLCTGALICLIPVALKEHYQYLKKKKQQNQEGEGEEIDIQSQKNQDNKSQAPQAQEQKDKQTAIQQNDIQFENFDQKKDQNNNKNQEFNLEFGQKFYIDDNMKDIEFKNNNDANNINFDFDNDEQQDNQQNFNNFDVNQQNFENDPDKKDSQAQFLENQSNKQSSDVRNDKNQIINQNQEDNNQFQFQFDEE